MRIAETDRRPRPLGRICISFVLFVLCATSCGRVRHSQEVVIYTSLDRPHSSPILERFEKETGIKVRAVYDTEASKTVGLTNRLLAEKGRPRADVFWNSEVLRTLILKKEGVLSPYASPSRGDIPDSFKDSEGYWTGFAARARVILVNTKLVSQPPESIADFADLEWKGRFAIANPLFGTTATEVAAWWSLWGADRTGALLTALKNNDVKIASGNGTARDMVAAGELAACLTDTDDAYGAIQNGRPVRMIVPDQGPAGEGTLLIPNTVALIKGGPNRDNAKKLIDFLLTPEVEEMLAFSASAQIPVRPSVRRPAFLQPFATIKTFPVNFDRALEALPASSKFIQEEFLR